jgi:hypothetical protein
MIYYKEELSQDTENLVFFDIDVITKTMKRH